MEKKSAWWGVGEEDDHVPPSVPEKIPARREEPKRCRVSKNIYHEPSKWVQPFQVRIMSKGKQVFYWGGTSLDEAIRQRDAFKTRSRNSTG